MKPFDLELAKQGYPVCTRSGRPARIICWDRKNDTDTPIIALISYNKGMQEEMYTFRTDGKYGRECYDELHCDDLMMAPIKCEGWANIYPSTDRKYYTFGQSVLFITEEEAKKHRVNGGITAHIEWEE